MEFDRIHAEEDVRWTPYSAHDVAARAPHGLSTFCIRDRDYWLTRKALVFDVIVEGYSPHRVLRQFGLYQTFPLETIRSVPAAVHGYVTLSFISFLQLKDVMLP